MSPRILSELSYYRYAGFHNPLASMVGIRKSGREAWERINSDPKLREYWDAVHAHAMRSSALITEDGILMSVSIEPHRPQWQRALRRWWHNWRYQQ